LSDAITSGLAVLAVLAQVALAAFLVVALLRLAGVAGPWRALRETLDGTELWLAFAVALVATGGSLFFSEIEHFPPCKLCWFQRIAMYPLVLLGLPAFFGDRLAARWFLPLPVVGLGIALWHVLVERGVVEETQSCQISAPGGCGVKWVEELGYVTIPTLAATAFALCIVLLGLAATRRDA
jgi:disulfide bond formation protein DsbB